MFLKSSHRGFRALHRGRAAGSLLHCNRIVGETQNELDRYMWFNHILQYYQADMSYTIYMVCSRFCTITKQNVFFQCSNGLVSETWRRPKNEWDDSITVDLKKKLCCTLGNGFKSLLFSSDCKVNMERCKIQSKCEQIKTHHSHLL